MGNEGTVVEYVAMLPHRSPMPPLHHPPPPPRPSPSLGVEPPWRRLWRRAREGGQRRSEKCARTSEKFCVCSALL
eukprot:6803875-Pyramimonas_sp.AAC.1